MRRRSRTRRVMKWAWLVTHGALLCAQVVLALAILYAGAALDQVHWTCSLPRGYVVFDASDDYTIFGFRRRITEREHAALATRRKVWALGSVFAERHVFEARRDERGTTSVNEFWVAYDLQCAPLVGFVLLMAYPVAFTVVFFYRQGQRAGRRHARCCQACGYDLTGNVSGVCPECGTSVPDARTPKASG